MSASVSGSIDSNVNSNPVIADPVDLSIPFPLETLSFPVMMKGVICFNLLTCERNMDNVTDVYSNALKAITILKKSLLRILSGKLRKITTLVMCDCDDHHAWTREDSDTIPSSTV